MLYPFFHMTIKLLRNGVYCRENAKILPVYATLLRSSLIDVTKICYQNL